jgi:hypothetical protein
MSTQRPDPKKRPDPKILRSLSDPNLNTSVPNLNTSVVRRVKSPTVKSPTVKFHDKISSIHASTESSRARTESTHANHAHLEKLRIKRWKDFRTIPDAVAIFFRRYSDKGGNGDRFEIISRQLMLDQENPFIVHNVRQTEDESKEVEDKIYTENFDEYIRNSVRYFYNTVNSKPKKFKTEEDVVSAVDKVNKAVKPLGVNIPIEQVILLSTEARQKILKDSASLIFIIFDKHISIKLNDDIIGIIENTDTNNNISTEITSIINSIDSKNKDFLDAFKRFLTTLIQ